MEENIRKKYNRAAKIIGILAGLILVLGTSYAVFRTVTTGEQDSVISAGKLDVRIENEQDEITLENAFPITEEEGKKQTPYTFDVVNEGTINAEYDLYIEIDESVSTLPVDVVRYYLTVEEDGTEKIVTSSARIISQEEVIEKEGKKLYKIYNESLNPQQTNSYKLYLWIDENATTEQATNKTFEAKVSIEAMQSTNPVVQQIDVSANGDGSAIAYMYADGSVVIQGQGQLKDNLSDTLVYTNEKFLDIYKKVFVAAGCPAEDVKSFTSLQEFENYLMRLQQEDPELYQSIISQDMNTLLQLVIMRDVLEDLGYDTNDIELTVEAYMTYLVEQGLMDEEGQFTEEGQEFYTKLEEAANSINNPTIPAKSIILSEGITNIPEGLFTGNEDIVKVSIPSTVNVIDNRAFYGCTGLKELNIPTGVTQIGSQAFQNCINLQKINLPSTVTVIGNTAFSNCKKLTSIELPNGLTTIGTTLFSNCSSLISVEIPESVLTIGNSAFSGCSSLQSIKIPENVTVINYYAFRDCTSLKTASIEGNITQAENMFLNCSSLATVKFGKQFTQIPSSMFASCTGLKKIIIPETVTTIGFNAFGNCTNLNTVEISNSVTLINGSAFSGCTSLTNIKLPENILSIGPSTFYRCTSLATIEIPESVTSIGDSAFNNCTSLTAIEIPESVTSIGSAAFRNCTSLTAIEIPESVTSIGNYSFQDCTGLTYLSVPGSLSFSYSNRDAFKNVTGLKKLDITGSGNMTYYTSTNYKYLPWYNSRNSIEDITIHDGLTSIGNYAFYDCTGLKQIDIPKNVTSVGTYTFNGCTSLEAINVASDNTTYISIDGILYNKDQTKLIRCPQAKDSISIPGSVTSIEINACYGCSKLTSLEISNNVTSIGNYAFQDCTGLTYLKIPGVISFSSNFFTNVSNLKTIDITGSGDMPNYTSTNYKYTPWYNSRNSIEDITIHDGITRIGTYAFRDCTNLRTIEIPESVTVMNQGAFQVCSNLISVEIPSDIIRIENDLFHSCGKLESVKLPSNVRYIGESAFRFCVNLTSINIPTAVTTIGDYAFYRCRSLDMLDIPNGVRSMGRDVFNGWTSSQTINIDNTQAYVDDTWNSLWDDGCNATINYLRT